MRLARVRFTTRRMMIAVAIAAVLAAWSGPELLRRWKACRVAADRQAGLARMCSEQAEELEKLAAVRPSEAGAATFEREKAAFHFEKSRWNRRAFFDPFHECILDKDIH